MKDLSAGKKFPSSSLALKKNPYDIALIIRSYGILLIISKMN